MDHQAPMDSSKLVTSQMLLDRLSGVTRQNRKGHGRDKECDDKDGRETGEGRQELIQWTVLLYML